MAWRRPGRFASSRLPAKSSLSAGTLVRISSPLLSRREGWATCGNRTLSWICLAPSKPFFAVSDLSAAAWTIGTTSLNRDATRAAPHRGCSVGSFGTHGAKVESFRREQDDLAFALADGSGPAPLADEAAGSVGSDVRRVGQFFVGHIEFDAARGFLADASCQPKEDGCQPFPGA